MQTLHIVSHTHWDREWYKTFQQFRLQLVHLVDNLLVILENDPEYLHFMLDGQTIVLEDYLQMRMANLPLLQKYIQENRILIGPWYILPDEYLVSPEATIRNLNIGKQICALFGQRMMIGYIPDPFGHIGQLPQIFKGFHMDTACLWRGVPKDTPTLVRWQAPDGSSVLLAHLYDGYGNVAEWPAEDPEKSLEKLDNETDKLEALNPTDHFLMMRGTDHLEPRPELPEHIRYYNQHETSDRRALHSTLPAYLAAVSKEVEEKSIDLQSLSGELRDPQKAHMLPGVYSARMWIKQRNHYSETLLERWVEPFSTWAELLKRGDDAFLPLKQHEKTTRLNDPGPIIHQTWKLLISNHPHDSICGCSIDETHNDMISRFDQVDQVGESLTSQSLMAIQSEIDTQGPDLEGKLAAVTVFNASPYPKTELVSVDIDVVSDDFHFSVVDAAGNELPCEWEFEEREFCESNTYRISALAGWLSGAESSGHNNQRLIRASFGQDPDMPCINAEFSNFLEPDTQNLESALAEIRSMTAISDPDSKVRVKIFNVPTVRLSFVAKDLPAMGYQTWWVRNQGVKELLPVDWEDNEELQESISNEFFTLILTGEDGSFSLHDKNNNVLYENLNTFVDRGDRGDEYNYTPPENDSFYTPKIVSVETTKNSLSEMMLLRMNLEIPIGLSNRRDQRSNDFVTCALDVALSLTRGLPQVNVQVVFDNNALDHRLEVRFPSGLVVDTARFDGHFQIVERPIDLPEADSTWRELPRPEVPQRAFTDVSIESHGLTIANRGLPEVAVLRDEQGKAEIALTLLRCVGWLSRDDLWNRQGQAGPPLPTMGAQEQATYLFNYAIIPHGADFGSAVVLAQSYQVDLDTIVGPLKRGRIAPSNQMVTVTPSEFMITTLKEAENEAGWILRGVNLSDETVDVKITANLPYKSVTLVNLDESRLADLELRENDDVELAVGAHKIVTFFFRISD
jgi:alpha-mannosidase